MQIRHQTMLSIDHQKQISQTNIKLKCVYNDTLSAVYKEHLGPMQIKSSVNILPVALDLAYQSCYQWYILSV